MTGAGGPRLTGKRSLVCVHHSWTSEQTIPADSVDRPKRRRSPSPNFPSHRTRRFSPEPHPHSTFALPDPASLPHQLTFKQFADWFRANHPNTAKADEEEFRQFKAGALGADAVKERVGMGKRYERYRKEYTSRQVSIFSRSAVFWEVR